MKLSYKLLALLLTAAMMLALLPALTLTAATITGKTTIYKFTFENGGDTILKKYDYQNGTVTYPGEIVNMNGNHVLKYPLDSVTHTGAGVHPFIWPEGIDEALIAQGDLGAGETYELTLDIMCDGLTDGSYMYPYMLCNGENENYFDRSSFSPSGSWQTYTFVLSSLSEGVPLSGRESGGIAFVDELTLEDGCNMYIDNVKLVKNGTWKPVLNPVAITYLDGTPAEESVTAPSVYLSVGNASGRPGDVVAVDVSVTQNGGFWWIALNGTYDTSLMTLQRVEFDPAFAARLDFLPIASGAEKFTIDGIGRASVPVNCTLTGRLATLYFKIKEGAATGKTGDINFTFDIKNQLDADKNPLPGMVVRKGSILVLRSNGETTTTTTTQTPTTTTTAAPTTTTTQAPTTTTTQGSVIGTGDANGDNSVDMKDVLVIRKFIANMGGNINVTAADVNGDGSVDMKDVLQIRKAIAGMDGVDISLSSAEGKPGDVIAVHMTINRNSGIWGMILNCEYDTSLLSFQSAAYNAAFTDKMKFLPVTDELGFLTVNGTADALTENCTERGQLVTLYFKISEDAAPGQTVDLHVSFNPNNQIDKNEKNVAMKVHDGSVKIN